MNALLCVDITDQFYAVHQTKQGLRIDYARFKALATKGMNLLCAYAYGVELEDEAYTFKAVLHKFGYEVRYRRASIIGDAPNIRYTDRNLMIAMDIWRHSDKIDVVILGSGNAELVPLVRRLQEKGIQVIACSFNISGALKDAVNRYQEVDVLSLEYRADDSR